MINGRTRFQLSRVQRREARRFYKRATEWSWREETACGRSCTLWGRGAPACFLPLRRVSTVIFKQLRRQVLIKCGHLWDLRLGRTRTAFWWQMFPNSSGRIGTKGCWESNREASVKPKCGSIVRTCGGDASGFCQRPLVILGERIGLHIWLERASRLWLTPVRSHTRRETNGLQTSFRGKKLVFVPQLSSHKTSSEECENRTNKLYLYVKKYMEKKEHFSFFLLCIWTFCI